ncbi:hypothetical protein JHK87_008632 [Glycine soja]|nr:hypothetical protein JHK87_008632 [Glycine soja]
MSSPCSCACASTNWSVDYGYGGGGVLSNSKVRSRRSKEISMAHSVCGSRRSTALVISSLPFGFLFLSPPAEARRNKKAIPEDQYITSPADGLKYYDLVEGKGPVAEKGTTVQVHFDCLYRGITAVSSRESKLLAGNRIIAQVPFFFLVCFLRQRNYSYYASRAFQTTLNTIRRYLSGAESDAWVLCSLKPYEFKVGAPPGKERKREFVDNPNGLFSAQAAPKPPPAVYIIVEGMRVGGKRTVIVPPENGYGQKGMNEIPPGATFELNVELLQVVAT